MKRLTIPTSLGPRDVIVDEEHLIAHQDHFALPLEQILTLVAEAFEDVQSGDAVGRTLTLDRIVGFSGLKELTPEDRPYWALRPGRTTPSHLIAGTPPPTHCLTAWCLREPDGALKVHTVYAGEITPREIHHPDIPLEDIDASIAFWTRHAIVVG